MRIALACTALVVAAASADAKPPKQSVIPKGADWYCSTRSDFAMGHCTREKEDCEAISRETGPGGNGSTWPECSQQKRAAVFTLRNKLDDRWFAIAEPSFQLCKENRRTWSSRDYDNISDCIGVGPK